MKRTCFLITFLLSILTLYSQAVFVPEQEIIKTGQILYQSPKDFVLYFSNKGDKPLKVLRISPSCGCTNVSLHSTEVLPGEKGSFSVTFDASTLGSFHKEFEIYTDLRPEPYYMAIQGTVVSTLSDYSIDYPIDLGNVRMLSNYIEFDNVNKGDYPEQILKIINTDRVPYRPELMHLPDYLTVSYEPIDIPAGKSGVIRLKLDSHKLSQFGLTQTSVYLARYMGDRVSDENEIVVNAVLLPDFPSLSKEEMLQAPSLLLSEETINMGRMGTKRKISKKVKLTNVGQTPLRVERLQVFNPALSVSLGSSLLKPGQSTQMKVTAHAEKLKKTNMRPRVLLITNDPRKAKVIIDVHVSE